MSRKQPPHPKALLARSIIRIVLVTTAIAINIITWGPAFTKNTALLYTAVAMCYCLAIPLIANAVQIFNNTRSRLYHISLPTGGWYTMRGSRAQLDKLLQETPDACVVEITQPYS